MISTEYLSFQKSLLNKKCEQQDTHINAYASLLFNREWKSHPYSFILGSPAKNKPSQTSVSLKNDILNWFKSLSNQEKLDVITIRDRDFIQKFLKFSAQQYEGRLINFSRGCSMRNILAGEQPKSNFPTIKNYLWVALTGEPLLFVSCESPAKLCQQIIDWLNEVTGGKAFEFANKIVNKEQGEDNLLWFNSLSMHPVESWLANQLQKSITRHYFKKDLLPSYKLKEFSDYMASRHPQQAKYLKLTIDQARKLSSQEMDNFCSVIKTHQNCYYEDLRLDFIESLEILENDKQQRKRKNKRKLKKKNTSTPLNTQTQTQTDLLTPHQQITPLPHQSLNQQDSDQQQLQLIPPQTHNQLKLQPQNQSTLSFTIQELNQKINKSEQGNPKKCICKDETSSHVTKQQKAKDKKPKEKNTNSKNLVMNKVRARSPFSKSNTLDNDCSQSIFSGEVCYDTYTEAITEQCTKKSEEFEIEIFAGQNEQVQNGEANGQKKQRRRRKNNNNSNRQIQQLAKNGSMGLINRQLTNFIDSLSIETNNLYESKVISFERVRYFIKNLFPQTQAMLFGSNSMGLSLQSSDVDIMLYNVPCKTQQEIRDMLAQIAIQINAMGWIVSCSTYLNAKAPLVKLQIDPLISYYQTKRRCDYPNVYDPMILYYLDVKDRKKAKNIFVDLTINLEDKDAGYSPSTQLMKSWVNADPTLQRIILLFKYILAEKGYNKNFSGGLGSYCLFIMIAAYFKQFKDQLPQDEGQIFLNVLKFYSEEFQNKLKSITLREQGSCFMSLEESLNIANFSEVILSNPLRIIDPLTQKLTSSSCSQYHAIKSEFRRIRSQIIGEMETIERQINQNYSPVPVNKLESTQKSIQKWIHKYENRTRFSIKKIIDGTTNRN